MQLDKSQKNAVTNILDLGNRVTILCGRAGYGKTHVVKTVASTAVNEYGINPDSIYFAASTGKAAHVLQSSIADLEMPNAAMTVHRMLEYGGDGWGYNAEETLPAKLVFIDESSMIDSPLFARILFSIDEDAQIVFVGDPSQLHPVGAGCPFLDIVKGKEGTGIVNELLTCWRQREGSLIADASEKCRNGKAILWGTSGEKSLGGKLEDDLFLHEVSSEDPYRHDNILQIVAEIAKPWFDNREDHVILAPQRTTGVGLNVANDFMQSSLNPYSPKKTEIFIGKTTFRVGDRVRQTKNDYKVGVFNGFVGTIIDINSYGKTHTMQVDYDGTVYTYPTKESMFKLVLGYVVTVHASQGSGYQKGVVIADNSHSFMWNRQLMYVALSRFKGECHFVGQKKTIAMAIRKNIENSRSTYLGEQLTENKQ